MAHKRKLLITLVIIAAFLILPTGTPDDFLIALPLIGMFGLPNMLLIGGILLFILWRNGVFKNRK